ncbi:unnamed protein product (macronuclear) [Paramecium tetraurelia]|uniref:FYVE-type domain-containing protein n=2 Tax=Paramecium tetraurelia TaxID=5888 RepID=A0D4X6_PARTE|nr:uncharacterized protein GSPATT00013540001 [Paramecium tetraurelia]CAK78093.1 unnamed protein product [Paramecium tetraurelia]|eukprot:XP_001445490.1 hypothetical protein (macronuclear) [Paramecium tetraurelia strain d4-2]
MSKSQPIFIYGITIKDDRGKLKNCQLCGAKFTMSVKEHQCKRCKRAVCDKCAPNKAQVQKADGLSKKTHRLCNFCKDESDSLKRFLEQYKISFNKDSFSQQWLQSFGTDTTKAKNDFFNALDDAKLSKDTNAYDIFKAKLEVVINDIDGFVNYSIKDFMVAALKNVESFRQKEVVKTSILRVAGTLLLLYPQIGYSHEIVLITYFLLCFASEASAYILLTAIYAHILPSQLYPKANTKYDLANENSIVVGVLKDALQVDLNDMSVIKSFLSQKLRQYLVTFSINLFLFETTFFIISSVLMSGSNGYMDLLAQMAVLCQLSNQEMQKNKFNHEETELFMLRSLRTNQLSVLYKQTQNCDFESYKKVYITTRSDSIKVDNLNLSARQSMIKPDMQKVSEINQKLQEQVDKRDLENKKLNEEIIQLRDKVKQLQKENSILLNQQQNNDSEMYKIKLHEMRIDNSELKSQIEQLKNEISKLKLQKDDDTRWNATKQKTETIDSDYENDLQEISQFKLKYEQQIKNLKKQAEEKKLQNQPNTMQIDELKESYENKIKLLQKQVQQLQQQDNIEEIRDLKIQNQQLQKKLEKMKDEKSKSELLQQKNDEIDLLTELNEELTKENQRLSKQFRDLKSQSGTSSAQQIKVLEEQNKLLEMKLEQYNLLIQELMININKVKLEKQKQLEFSDLKLKQKEDLEDVKMVAEIRTVQTQLLKGMLKENQAQLSDLIAAITQMRQILEKSKTLKL